MLPHQRGTSGGCPLSPSPDSCWNTGDGLSKLLSCFPTTLNWFFFFSRGTFLLVLLSNFTSALYIEGTGKKSTRSHYRTRRMQDFKFDTMPSNTADQSPDSGTTGMSLKDTELTLGLPGEAQVVIVGGKSCSKRGYSDTVDFRFRCCSGESSAKAEKVDWPGKEISGPGKAPDSKWEPWNILFIFWHFRVGTWEYWIIVWIIVVGLWIRAQVVGWPPVRSVRKKALKSCKYVKVAVDGAPYLRKVDLEVHRSYQQLLMALETMFDCFTISSKHFFSSLSLLLIKYVTNKQVSLYIIFYQKIHQKNQNDSKF